MTPDQEPQPDPTVIANLGPMLLGALHLANLDLLVRIDATGRLLDVRDARGILRPDDLRIISGLLVQTRLFIVAKRAKVDESAWRLCTFVRQGG